MDMDDPTQSIEREATEALDAELSPAELASISGGIDIGGCVIRGPVAPAADQP